MLIFSDESFFSKSWSTGLMSRTNLKQKENAQKRVSTWMMFDNVLNRKQGFLAYKNVTTIICIMEKINLFSKE